MAAGFTDLATGKVIAGLFKVLCSPGIDIMASIMAGPGTTAGLMRILITPVNTCPTTTSNTYATTNTKNSRLALLQIVGGDKLIIPFC